MPHSSRYSTRFGALAIPLILLLMLVCNACNSGKEGATLRVMSYNIAAGYGDLDRIIEVIREYDPDIVALQEVDIYWGERSGYQHQLTVMAEQLGLYPFTSEIYTLDPVDSSMPARRYGLAFLSKHPFLRAENHPIHRLSTQHEAGKPVYMPGFPEVAIDFQGQTLHLYNTHLDYRSDPAVRELQIRDMLSIIEQREAPALLLGDLNARPGYPELNPLFEPFRDAWNESEGPGYTFPSSAPDRRIDYILHSPQLEILTISVPETEASDHLPVVADLKWR